MILKSLSKIVTEVLIEDRGVVVERGFETKDEKYLARNLLPSLEDVLMKRGIDVTSARKLGKGASGIAYDLGNNQVLKMTLDKDEANAAAYIKGKNLKNVYQIFDVFVVDDEEDNWFGILQEKLKRLDSVEYSVVSFIQEPFNKFGGGTIQAKDVMPAVNELIQYNLENESQVKIANEMAKQLFTGMKQLRKHGIHFEDLHGGNVMKRGNEYVIIDLGYSISPGWKDR